MIRYEKLRLSEKLMYSTVRIESLLSDGRVMLGTGFLMKYFMSKKDNTPVVVSNKHVIVDSIEGRFFIPSKKIDSDSQINIQASLLVDRFEQRWIKHPNSDVDLAVMPIGAKINEWRSLGIEPISTFIDTSVIPSNTQWKKFVPLDELCIIGYPTGS
jgi:hypothetical protein